MSYTIKTEIRKGDEVISYFENEFTLEHGVTYQSHVPAVIEDENGDVYYCTANTELFMNKVC